MGVRDHNYSIFSHWTDAGMILAILIFL